MELKEFIDEYANVSPDKLRLKFSGKNLSPEDRAFYDFAILQIEARKKFGAKFRHLLHACPDFRFPAMLAGEQASHEAVATYHAGLIGDCSTLLDMTAGLGIDFLTIASAMSKSVESSTKITPNSSCPEGDAFRNNASDAIYLAAEMDSVKADTLRENIKVMNLAGAEVFCGDSMQLLRNLDQKVAGASADSAAGLIFVDPARRGEGDKRLYDPADCSPDIVTHWDLLRRNAARIIVKNTPMLDPVRAVSLFPGATEIHIVSYKNECKEVLIIADTQVDENSSDTLKRIVCVNIGGDGDIASYTISAEDFGPPTPETIASEDCEFSGGYLYEPNASLMKVITRCNLCNAFKRLAKLSPNCHLYFSDTLYPDFPGRILGIEGLITKSDRKALKGKAFNVATRNYPEGAEKLKKSLKVNSATSDREFIYGATLGFEERPVLIKCASIS